MGYVIDVAPTVQSVTDQVKLFGNRGKIHGSDSNGRIDVEFPNVHDAAIFSSSLREALGWESDIRKGDSVTSLINQPCTITIEAVHCPREL